MKAKYQHIKLLTLIINTTNHTTDMFLQIKYIKITFAS